MEGGFTGWPWKDAERFLKAAGIPYETEITRPGRDFFKTDEKYLYVLREKHSQEGMKFVLAARCTGILPQ